MSERGSDLHSSAFSKEGCEILTSFRNPFRFAIDSDTDLTVLRINDVGGQRREEID
jgi:hypothetical protein